MKPVRIVLLFLAFLSPSKAPSWQSDWAVGGYAVVVDGLAAAVVTITAGEWYARRRWLR